MNLKQALLWPLTLPYGAVARLRARAYETGLLSRKRLSARVISVGNLTAGGTGKTPMVLWIAQRLLASGNKVGILTRGYKGSAGPDGPTSDEVDLLRFRLGDRVAFGVGADRYAKGSELAARGTDWFVLDDGFQHQQLARDIDIVLIDAANPFGGGRLLPAGLMREPKTALRRADAIVITRSGHAPAVEAAIRRDSEAPIFYAHAELETVRTFVPGRSGEEMPSPRTKKWFAFCGIGNPQAFLADLHDWGFQVAGHRRFRDHHRYTQVEIDALAAEARACGAEGLLCTEKDRFNLGALDAPPMGIAYCQISLQVDRGEDLWDEVQTLVRLTRAKKI